MRFFYKKCEVYGDKMNKIIDTDNSYENLSLTCKKCGAKYEISKFIGFYIWSNRWLCGLCLIFLYFSIGKIQESFEILKNISIFNFIMFFVKIYYTPN